MGEPKSKSTKRRSKYIVIAIAVLVLLIIVGRVSAMSKDLSRTETPEATKTTNVSSEKKEAVKTAENKPEEKPAEVPAPAPVDPNGCEAKGMYWRADNFECIEKPKPAINETVPESTAAATSVTTQSSAPAASGSGDCSLVYGYNWPTSTAYRVCMQESGGNSHTSNWSDDHTSWAGCMGSFGLFQINCSHGQVYDGASNVAIAYQMWSAAGGSFWQDWPNTCRKVGC